MSGRTYTTGRSTYTVYTTYTVYSHLMEEYCTHQQTMPCTRRSPARLVGRIPPAEAVDGEIFIASAWASLNLGHAYLSSRCSHLLVSRLYTDLSIANLWEREGGRTCYEGRSTASGGLRAYN